MDKQDTIIVVGVTRLNEYGDLWVTPQDGGDEVKIGAKRARLHPVFEQGRAVMLHWETYKGKTYVADAKPVEGELPPATEPYHAEQHPDETSDAKPDKPTYKLTYKPPQSQYRGRDEDKVSERTAIMEIGADFREGKRDKKDPLVLAREVWLMGIMGVTEAKPKEPDKAISAGDIKELAYNQCNWTKEDLGKYCQKKWKAEALSALSQAQKDELYDHIKNNPK